MITIENKDKFDKRQWVKLINSLSGAKSANLVGTISKAGSTNLTIISSTFHLGAAPALMGFVLRPHSKTSPRHTLLNIEESKYFSINHVNSGIFKQAHQTSARYKRDESEFKACGLNEIFKDKFVAPFVKESNIQIGLKLVEIINIKLNATHIVIGEITNIYLQNDTLREDGSVDIHAAGTIAVSGLDEYHKLAPMARLSYAKPKKNIEEL